MTMGSGSTNRFVATSATTTMLIWLACMPLTAQSTVARRAPETSAKKLLYVIQVIQNVPEESRRLKALGERTERYTEMEAYMADHPKMLEHLAALGFVVTVTDESGPAANATAHDLVLISEYVSGSKLAEKYRHVPVPVIIMESDLYDEMRMTGKDIDTDYGEYVSERIQRASGNPDPAGNPAPQRFLWMVNAPHPLSAGLPAGLLRFFTSHDNMNWGLPGAGAIEIATIPGHRNKVAIFAYEKGATMDGENLAPARRVAFPLRTLGGLSPEGVALFDAALEWAVAKPE